MAAFRDELFRAPNQTGLKEPNGHADIEEALVGRGDVSRGLQESSPIRRGKPKRHLIRFHPPEGIDEVFGLEGDLDSPGRGAQEFHHLPAFPPFPRGRGNF